MYERPVFAYWTDCAVGCCRIRAGTYESDSGSFAAVSNDSSHTCGCCSRYLSLGRDRGLRIMDLGLGVHADEEVQEGDWLIKPV